MYEYYDLIEAELDRDHLIKTPLQIINEAKKRITNKKDRILNLKGLIQLKKLVHKKCK